MIPDPDPQHCSMVRVRGGGGGGRTTTKRKWRIQKILNSFQTKMAVKNSPREMNHHEHDKQQGWQVHLKNQRSSMGIPVHKKKLQLPVATDKKTKRRRWRWGDGRSGQTDDCCCGCLAAAMVTTYGELSKSAASGGRSLMNAGDQAVTGGPD